MHDFLTLKSKEMEVGGAPEIISVLPLGHVKSAKGEFDVDGESFAAMKAQIAQRGVDLVVDYEHQTLTGEQAPAAGWVKELFLDDGQIKARVEWTDRAKAYLSNREYRYLSPVITVRKADNKAMGLHSIALTNTPAIEHMEAIVNSLNFEGGQNTMDFMKELAKLLGLGEDATEEQVKEALKACLEENKSLKESAAEAAKQQPPEDDKVVANKEVCELLGLKAGAATADVAAAIMALKSGNIGGVNLAEQVKSLEAKLADRDAEEAVEMALKAGKITPAQREWAKGYALKNLEDFKGFVEKAPQVVPMGDVGGSESLALKRDEVDEATLLVCKQLGISAEDVKQYGMKGE